MEYLPVFLKLDKRPGLVVGGGAVAERKVRLLMRAGARVTVAAGSLSRRLAELRDAGKITHHAGAFGSDLLHGVRIVIAATDDPELNHTVSIAADDAGIPCNVVDDGDASGFIMPAIIDRSPVVIAIGTGGNAPVLAQRLKSRIEAWLPARIGALAAQAGRWRAIVGRRFATVRERRRFWQRFFDGPIAAHLLANRRRDAEHAFRLELIDSVRSHTPPPGEAWIVGAGPGDPGLVTLRGQQLISQADVILHDRLVSDDILEFARKDATLISVGKSANGDSSSQKRINELLVSHVRAGRRVCRLKGGDPFVFGRGGEEIIALARAGLPFQVVPGISAALGCAAYAGLPLTHRGLSTRVVLAAARLGGKRSPDWRALARPGQTLVLYMGVGSLAETARKLVENGLDGRTPVAVVENGTTERQRVLRGTLSTIVNRAVAARVHAPATIFVGETAGLESELQWFANDQEPAESRSPQMISSHRDSPEPGAAGMSGCS